MSTGELDFALLFKATPAPCLVLDRELNIVAATDTYLDSVGRDLDELKGKYVFDAFPESGERLAMFKDAFERAVRGEANELVNVPYSIPVVEEGKAMMRDVWWTCYHNPVFDADGEVRFMVQKAQDVTRHIKAERLKDAIAAELQHRVGNILTLVSVIAKRTADTSDTLEDFQGRFEGRIHALSKTHSYLTGTNWNRMTIEKVISRQLSDYSELDSDQIVMEGADIDLNPSEAQILTLAIHELTTNSVKHGALKTGDGKLAIAWDRVGPTGFKLEWREDGVSPSDATEAAPKRKGFGSLILDVIVPAQLQGAAQRELVDETYIYSLSVDEREAPV